MSSKNDEKQPLLNKNFNEQHRQTKMKKGQYQLQVLVETTSGLSLGDIEQTLDVVISLQAFGKKQYSPAKQGIGYEQTFWGETFSFRKQFEDATIAQGQKLLISVYNRQKRVYESLIGNHQISIGSIYAEKNHAVLHKWLALSNLQFAFTQVVGYIKVSMSIIGQKDRQIELETEAMGGIKDQKNLILPPTIEKKNYQLSVQIFQGENINAGNNKRCDSYIGVEFGSLFSKTQPNMKNMNPIYMEKVCIPISLPAINQKVALRVNDFNFITKIQLLGSYYINISQIIEQVERKRVERTNEQGSLIKQKNCVAINRISPYTEAQWINFYGPSADSTNQQYKNIYQFFPHLSPYYIGSVLMRFSISEKDVPERKVVRIKQNIPKPKKINFILTALINAAVNLYKKNASYKICVSMGSFQMSTDNQKAVNGYCSWNIQKNINVSFYENQLLPDVFVYLVEENGQKVCFLRYNPFPNKEDYNRQTQIVILEDSWVLMKPDLSKSKIKNEQGGYLKIGLTILKSQTKVPNSQKRLSNMITNFSDSKDRGKLIIQLICAENLIPLDQQGSSDAFFQFLYMNKNVFSSTKNETLNPIYFQKLVIDCQISKDSQKLLPLIINAYDKDRMSKQLIGTTFIDLSKGISQNYVKYGLNQKSQPKWLQLKQNNVTTGRFLACFTLLENCKQQIPKSINLPCQQYVLSFLLLGIRGLKINNFISSKNPYLIFDIDSFDVFESDKFDKYGSQKASNQSIQTNYTNRKQSKNIVTQPRSISQILDLKIFEKKVLWLPKNPQYWPNLSVRIKNQVMNSIYEPVIGYFSIDLRKSFQTTKSSKQTYQKQTSIMTNRSSLTNQFDSNEKLRNIDHKLLYNLRNSMVMSLNYSWTVMNRDIVLNDQNKQEKYNPDVVVVFPLYEEIQKGRSYQQRYKNQMLNNRNYMKVGTDNNLSRAKKSLLERQKHYRFVLNSSLEEYQISKTGNKLGLFDQVPIKTGRVFNTHQNSILQTLTKKISDEDRYIGKYKGHCFIEKVNGVQSSKVAEKFEDERNIFKSFIKNQKFHMYLYILEAFNIPQKDLFSKSDPYLVVKVGKKVQNFRKQYFEDNQNPQFNKKVYSVVELPQDSILQIQIWDFDSFAGDDLIGCAIIDLENRIFYQKNNITFNNPIQTHKLTVKQSKIAQGSIRFWIDLVPQDKHSLYRQFEIGNQHDSQFEVRVIIWNCDDIPDNDIQGMSDIYISCTFNNETQQTDTHIRAVSGHGTFNWRCVFNTKLPSNNSFLTFKVFDKDLLSKNDYLGSTTFSIANILEQAFETQESQKLYIGKKDLTKYYTDGVSSFIYVDGQKRFDIFEVGVITKPEKGSKQKQAKNVGKIAISVEVLPIKVASLKTVGKGRSAPNQYPYLPQPKDRIQWSWNPCVMAARICGKSFRYKIALVFCILFFLFILYNFGLAFAGTIVANLTSK